MERLCLGLNCVLSSPDLNICLFFPFTFNKVVSNPIQFEKPFSDLPTMIDKKAFYREMELFRLTSGFKINVLKSH